jgi:predicted RNA binding protein YcfA (HicA-like mRNA interferase family)
MRPITGEELCRRLNEAGWSLKRIHGSHHIYGKPGEWKIISVPVHGTKLSNPAWPIGSPGMWGFRGELIGASAVVNFTRRNYDVCPECFRIDDFSITTKLVPQAVDSR